MEMVPLGLTNFPDGIRVGSNAGATALFVIGSGTAAVTAAQLNTLNGAGQGAFQVSAPVAGRNLGFGTGLVTGSANFATGLAGVITAGVASFQALNAGGGTTQGYCIATPVGTFGGSVGVQVYDKAGVLGTAATSVAFFAWGTA